MAETEAFLKDEFGRAIEVGNRRRAVRLQARIAARWPDSRRAKCDVDKLIAHRREARMTSPEAIRTVATSLRRPTLDEIDGEG